MERKGASYRITESRPQQPPEPTRGMHPSDQWHASNDDLYLHDRALSLSVSRHPSGGYGAEVANHSWDPEDPQRFKAGPFRTPLRAQVAAESLGERVTDPERPSAQKYLRRFG